MSIAKPPLVYSCSGCSSAAQMANHLALALDREGAAEMSCIAGVGGGPDLQIDALPARAEVEARAAASLTDLLLLASRLEDADTLFFQRRLSVSGDTELGLLARNLLDQLDWSQVPLALRIVLNRARCPRPAPQPRKLKRRPPRGRPGGVGVAADHDQGETHPHGPTIAAPLLSCALTCASPSNCCTP